MATIPDFLLDYVTSLPPSSKKRIFFTYCDGLIQKFIEINSETRITGLNWYYLGSTLNSKKLPLYSSTVMVPPYLKADLKHISDWKKVTQTKTKTPTIVHVHNWWFKPEETGKKILKDLDNTYSGSIMFPNSKSHSALLLSHRKDTLKIRKEIALVFQKKNSVPFPYPFLETLLNQIRIAIAFYLIEKIFQFLKPFVILFFQRFLLLGKIQFQIIKQKILQFKSKQLEKKKIQKDLKKEV